MDPDSFDIQSFDPSSFEFHGAGSPPGQTPDPQFFPEGNDGEGRSGVGRRSTSRAAARGGSGR